VGSSGQFLATCWVRKSVSRAAIALLNYVTQLPNCPIHRQLNALPPTMIAMAMKIDAITIATATVATLPEVPSRRMAYAEHAQTAHN
jgi:hypothetical protein